MRRSTTIACILAWLAFVLVAGTAHVHTDTLTDHATGLHRDHLHAHGDSPIHSHSDAHDHAHGHAHGHVHGSHSVPTSDHDHDDHTVFSLESTAEAKAGSKIGVMHVEFSRVADVEPPGSPTERIRHRSEERRGPLSRPPVPSRAPPA